MGGKTRVILGLVGIVIGGIWLLQGLNLLPGSFMTGDSTWVFIGLAVVIAGLVVLVNGFGKLRK